MSALANWLAGLVRARVTELAPAGEARLIFHGPPLEILNQVYDCLAVDPVPVGLPVLLHVPELEPGQANPAIGHSGHCDESHLLDLRNSPTASSYLALVPPGQHAILSVSSTTDEFGMSAASSGGNVTFEDWFADPFVQRVVEAALEATGVVPGQLDEARGIVVRALRSVDDVNLNPERHARRSAWRLLSRLFSARGIALPAARAISLACGVPPMEADVLSASQQHASLGGVTSALSEGFCSGLQDAMENATPEQRLWLEGFLAHIRVCDVPTALERAPEAFYAPSADLELVAPPAWWSGLTAELWAELLSDEPEISGDIRIECSNPLLPASKGIPLLVEGAVELLVQVDTPDARQVTVTLSRTPKGPSGFPAEIDVEGEVSFRDDQPPVHRSPIHYKAAAKDFRPASIRVISLATWRPGIFVACRVARKIAAPKAPARRARVPNWETSIALPGPGRYELLVFLAPGSSIASQAIGTASGEANGSEEQQELVIREMQPGLHQMEVEADGSYQIDIPFERSQPDGKVIAETCRVFLTCEDVVEEGCQSEFERLIKLNRRQVAPSGAKSVVQLNRSARTSSLQGWMLQEDAVDHSFLPLVISDDYSEHWMQPKWSEESGRGRILSSGAFLKDPRPATSDFQPPQQFVSARRALALLIRGEDDQSGLLEAAPLGEWLRRHETFPGLVEGYLDAYASWLRASPEVATWVDVVAVCSLEAGGRTLSRVPDALLLSPLHPLRLAWHAVAQGVLEEAATGSLPCPAAGILDPGMVPDVLRMPLVSPEGIEWVTFLSAESNSDYWSVLWNGTRLSSLPERSRQPPFGGALGLSVGGVSTGFSAGQVARALDDVSNVLCAKPVIGVVVASAGAATDSCNDGLVAWSAARYSEGDRPNRRSSSGPRRLDIYDTRDEGSRPDEATIANLSEDTGNSVRWFAGSPRNVPLDLGIIAQLDSSEPEAAQTTTMSALGAGGLIRHRVRRQLPNAFLSESRQARTAEPSGDPLADKVAACLAAMENMGDRPIGLRFAPNVHAIGEMLDENRADFVAVSSSSVDPACFLGDWLPNSYLWDYDLPSYSQRAGDTNGYYLLSRVKPSDLDGLRKVISRLPGCESLGDEEVGRILLEVARRGIPTIRGLSGDDTGAIGDLGLFVAARLLQDRFRIGSCPDSLLPVVAGTRDEPEIALLMPVDPFRGYLDDLARAINKDRVDFSLNRPDLLVVCATLNGGRARIHLTPVEVKCRLGQPFPPGEVADALGQARALSDLLAKLASHSDRLSAWRLAYQHLLLSMIGFGMRVYSQHGDIAGTSAEWASFHELIANAILGDDTAVTVDGRGRLVIIDDSLASDARDSDGDGFEETIVIGMEDAGRIVAGDADAFYESVRARLGDWHFRGASLVSASAGAQGAGDAQGEDAAPVEEDPRPEAEAPPASSQAGQPDQSPRPEPPAQAIAAGGAGVALAVGSTVDGFERRQVSLALSDTRLNQLNMGVVGDLGTGKTQLLKSLVHQIASAAPTNREIRPRILVLDYKRDYSSPDFVEATGARVVRPHRLPLNLFDTSAIGESTVPWLDRFRFFADVLDKIYSGIGPVQRDKLKKAVKSAYGRCPGGSAPTIYDVHAEYAALLDGKSDSPMAIIDDLVDMEIFEQAADKTRPFGDFLDGVVVVSLDALGQDDRSKNMLVAILLNMFYENMLRTPKRPFIGTAPQLRAIDSYLLVDEADNIMQYEFDVLRKLLLQGREFGCGVILASQYLRHFKVNATDYREPLLTWFIHKVPNITPGELGALGLAASAAEVAERVKALPNHHCLYKSFDSPGQVIRGLPFFEFVSAGGAGA